MIARLVAGVLALIVASACATAVTDDLGRIVLTEFAIESPDELPAGAATLRVENRGEFGHTVVVTRADGAAVAATQVVAAGDSTELSLELEPGDYMLTCRIVVATDDGRVVDHYEAGMVTDLRVAGGA